MKLWMAAVVALVPVQQADEALKKETAYNSLQRFALPRLPFGAHCDVTEAAGSPVCFLSWRYDLDDPMCAPLKAAIEKGVKEAGIAATDSAALAPIAAKALWHPLIEGELSGEYARLQKALGVKLADLRFGGCINFRWNRADYCLMTKGSTKEWGFVSH